MKKILAVAAAMATLATAAFADVIVGGWGRGIAVPAAGFGEDVAAFRSTSWGGQERVGVSIDGVSDNVGFHIDFNADNGNLGGVNDQSKIWIKPVDMLTLSVGKIQDDTIRGNACFGSWNWIRPNWIDDEGWTFSRTIDILGMEAALKPIEGLDILVGIPMIDQGWGGKYLGGTDGKAEDAYKSIKVGAGYKIEGIGQIKAQFLGDSAEDSDGDKVNGTFEAAFNLTAVENLFAEVGVKLGLNEESDKQDKDIRGYVTYNFGAGAVSANFGVKLYGNSDLDPSTCFGVGVDYNTSVCGLTADVRVAMPQNDVDPSVAFLIGASKGFSNGKLSVGFQGVNVGKDSGTGFVGSLKPIEELDDGTYGYSADGFAWAIPVCFEYWF